MTEIKPTDMNFVSKRWGWELWICNTELYCGKILFIKQGRYCSFHYHEKKDEVLHVQSGKIWMTYQDEEESRIAKILPAGHAFHVTPGMRHQMEAIEDTYIIEFSTQHFDEDSYRVTTDLVRQKPKVTPLDCRLSSIEDRLDNLDPKIEIDTEIEIPPLPPLNEEVMELLKRIDQNTTPKVSEKPPGCEHL